MNKILNFINNLFSSKIKEETSAIIKEAMEDFQDSKPIKENMTHNVVALETTPTVVNEIKTQQPSKPKKKKKPKPKTVEPTQIKSK